MSDLKYSFIVEWFDQASSLIKQYILIDGNIFGLDSWALKNYKIVHQKSDPDDKLPDIKYQQ